MEKSTVVLKVHHLGNLKYAEEGWEDYINHHPKG